MKNEESITRIENLAQLHVEKEKIRRQIEATRDLFSNSLQPLGKDLRKTVYQMAVIPAGLSFLDHLFDRIFERRQPRQQSPKESGWKEWLPVVVSGAKIGWDILNELKSEEEPV